MGPGTSFACPPLTLCAPSSSLSTTYAVIAASSELSSPEEGGRVLWAWQDNSPLRGKEKQKLKRSKIVVRSIPPSLVNTNHALFIISFHPNKRHILFSHLLNFLIGLWCSQRQGKSHWLMQIPFKSPLQVQWLNCHHRPMLSKLSYSQVVNALFSMYKMVLFWLLQVQGLRKRRSYECGSSISMRASQYQTNKDISFRLKPRYDNFSAVFMFRNFQQISREYAAYLVVHQDASLFSVRHPFSFATHRDY